MKKILLTSLTMLVLAGCGGGSDNDSESNANNGAPFANEPSQFVGSIDTADELMNALRDTGSVPILDRSSDLNGPDSNANGVRDDIDTYIDDLPLSQEQAASTRALAQSFQSITSETTLTEQEAAQISVDSRTPIACFARGFENPTSAQALFSQLEAYTFNTYDRAQRYDAYNTLRDGSVTRLASDVSCDFG